MSPPRTSSSRSMPWPTPIPAAPTPELSSTRSSPGAPSTTTPSRWSPRSRLYTFLFDTRRSTSSPSTSGRTCPSPSGATIPGATGADPSRVIGTGPFKFQEWRQGESVTLVRNDDYYGKVPYLDTYMMRDLARPDGGRQRAAEWRDRRRRARASRHRGRRRNARHRGRPLPDPRLHATTSSISIPR